MEPAPPAGGCRLPDAPSWTGFWTNPPALPCRAAQPYQSYHQLWAPLPAGRKMLTGLRPEAVERGCGWRDCGGGGAKPN